MCRGRGLNLAFSSGKVPHVNLQRIASRLIAVNQFVRKLNFLMRNLVQRIDFGVVHNGHIEAMIHRFVHKNRIQYTSRVNIQPERDVADAEDCLDLGQFFLDPLDRIQRFDPGSAVFFLPCRYGQRECVKNQIYRANAILLRRQVVNAFGNSHFLFGCKRHSFFIDCQCDYRRAVTLRHREHL